MSVVARDICTIALNAWIAQANAILWFRGRTILNRTANAFRPVIVGSRLCHIFYRFAMGWSYRNALTDMITAQPDCPVFEVIIHLDLALAVLNEAQIFMEYLKGQDPEFEPGHTRLHTLFDWALSGEPNKRLAMRGRPEHQAQLVRFALYQPNRNASTVLAYPSRSLWALVEQQLKDRSQTSLCDLLMAFLDRGNPLRLSPIFTGHFQRIFDCFLRASKRVDEWLPRARLEQLVGFCFESIDVLPYQQFITHLMTDFATTLECVHGQFGFLRLILRRAVRRTLEVHNIILQKSARDQVDMAMSLQRSRIADFKRFQRVPTDFEPGNWKGKRIPTARWLIGDTAA
jgi:hypothetical protein